MGRLTRHDVPLAQMDAVTLHGLLKLRSDVFVVEQACIYPDIDDRDVEPTTRHVWLADPDGRPAAYLRRLTDPDGTVRVGRVVTRADRRGEGLSRRLVGSVLADLEATEDGGVVVLEAQSHLAAFYASMGFVVAGPEYVEDGIPHVPMRRVRP